MESKNIEKIVEEVLKQLSKDYKGDFPQDFIKDSPQSKSEVSPDIKKGLIPVGISVRHIHLSQEDIESLFGKGKKLTPMRNLLQKGEFAAEECVMLIGPRMKAIENVRILGPIRDKTQVEVSLTDSIQLGLRPPVKPSGEHDGTPGILVVGPAGFVNLTRGVIRANRHIHISIAEAGILGLKDSDKIMVNVCAERPLIYSEVQVRVRDSFVAEMHLDTDDANAAGVRNGDLVQLIRSVIECPLNLQK